MRIKKLCFKSLLSTWKKQDIGGTNEKAHRQNSTTVEAGEDMGAGQDRTLENMK